MSETQETRSSAYAILEAAGYSLTPIGKGNRVVMKVQKGGSTFDALVKTASLGNAMVKTSSGDPDTAKISGFGGDTSHVIFAVGGRRGRVDAYLVPSIEAEEAFRKAQRDYLPEHPNAVKNTTWVIYFGSNGDAGANGYANKWAKYRIVPDGGPSAAGQDAPERTDPAEPGKLTIAEAKRLLALSLGVRPEDVKISINA
ncbi:hypothetical protein PRN20_01400 [Devosia sp. ZB163]|uniref:hypothetical protein n=1 Tax=Devosia sp. ZB163 TaxID=3025938 RepID=UPI002360D30E|nr:hypothetical protein [Devosia sp. ZB163]MDC9822373.1 hypothetical protein [Devosia sp. ZB163]